MSVRPSRKGAFQIPHRLFDKGVARGLGASAWAVYCCLLRHADRAGHCYPTEMHLCHLTGLGRTTVSQSIRKLARLELLTVTKEQIGVRKQHRNHYQLRVDTRQGFYQLVEREWIDRGTIAAIGVSAWMVYTSLRRHTNTRKQGVCHPSHIRLAELTGLSESTVGAAIKKLKAARMIRVVKQHRPAGHAYNIYHLTDQQNWNVVPKGTLLGNSEPTYVQNLGVKNSHLSNLVAEIPDAPDVPGMDSSPWEWTVALALNSSPQEQVLELLCLHLGGRERLVKLLQCPSPEGLPRSPWLRFSYKVVQRLVLEGRESDTNLRQQDLIDALDRHLLQRHKKRSVTEASSSQHSRK